MPKPKPKSVPHWQTLSSSPALEEKWFKVRRDVVKLPSGRVMDDYFIWESPTIAVIVPYTKEGKFVMVRQYRHAVDEELDQYPAGAVDKGEEPIDAARRELEEETGYRCGDLIPLGVSSPYSTKLSGRFHIFLAMDAEPTGTAHEDDSEITETFLVDKDDLLEFVTNNDLHGGETQAATLLAMRRLKLL